MSEREIFFPEDSENDNTTVGDRVEPVVMCQWWQQHKYGKWEDLQQEVNMKNQPVLIQERRCKVCNSAQRQTVLMN